MIDNKYKKILIISFCVVFALMTVVAGIMMTNIMHKEHCRISNCQICDLINISTEFIKNIEILSIHILVLFLSVPLIKLVKYDIRAVNKLNLVKLKVIQIK